MSARLAYETATVGYPGVTVVREATLGVAPGEVVGLIGPNGAGKSTLLRAVTGAARVSAGRITLAGEPLAAIGPRERARIVGVVPQAVSAAFSFSAREFVLMGRHPHLGRLQQVDSADISLAEEVMERTDTLRLAAEPVDTLSGGDLQRLALAQALAQEPSVLLLDEATSHLDLNHRLQVLDLVRELADAGLAVLAVFHDLDLAARFSDRLGVVAAGLLGPIGPAPEVLTVPLLARVFGVRAVVGTDAVTGAVVVTPVLREEAVTETRRGRVLVVGGSGTAAPLLRRLHLAGYEVQAAALNRGDVDQAVAEALGLERVDVPAFGEVDAEAEAAVERMAAGADAIVVCEVPFGRANLGNLRALARAAVRTVLIGRFGPEREFSGGEATALVDGLQAAGAVTVVEAGEAVAEVERLTSADSPPSGR
ncbi:MAG: ATP-binding cassette domain-containing protein [Coriobacteriia bacterium]|nr:ATP-binding cassette domain-containing protein [Coriobacteriia bacterium]